MTNKRKLINDPVHGFINIPSELIHDLIQHPYFQRLRRIKQLGLSELVYPGATHTRFHHALGAMHLMGLALTTLMQKGVHITSEEFEGAQIAILLHDLGHGAMSHSLEYTLLREVPHEAISLFLMNKLNQYFDNRLTLAIKIFEDKYPRRFFHQLVSSQLDMDRMDYLQRDCFFTGVHEGTIGADRIIKMLAVVQDELVVEEKAIYSLENFLTARRLMYWQVYLHKTNIAAEQMLACVVNRVRYLLQKGKEVPIYGQFLQMALMHTITLDAFQDNEVCWQAFTRLDDYDIWASLKEWANTDDYLLALLSRGILDRKLFKVSISAQKFEPSHLKNIEDDLIKRLNLKHKHLDYLLMQGTISNEAYWREGESINVLMKNGQILDLAQASDLPNIKALRKVVKKYFVAYLR